MAGLKIAVMVGSLRKESLNRRLASALMRMGPPEMAFQFVEIGDLPQYNQDDDFNQAPQVLRMKEELDTADGFLFVTPEYNRSFSGVLKNALDHATRPDGPKALRGKPAGVIGISPGALGTALAQLHLRQVLASLDVLVFGLPEAYIQYRDGFFDEAGDIFPASRAFLQGWMDRFVEWARLIAH